jgi:hypothetical protein
MRISRESNTPRKCGRLPAPDVAYDAFAGFARTQATYSFQVFAPLAGAHGQRELKCRAEPDRREIPDRVVADGFQRVRDNRHRADRHHHDCRAVWTCRFDRVRCDPTGGAWPIFDDHRLSERVLQLVRDDTCDEVGRPSRGEADEDVHRLVHPLLRGCGRSHENQSRKQRAGRRTQEVSNRHAGSARRCSRVGATNTS